MPCRTVGKLRFKAGCTQGKGRSIANVEEKEERKAAPNI